MDFDSHNHSQPDNPSRGLEPLDGSSDDWFQYDNPKPTLYKPSHFDLEIKREGTRRIIVLILLSQQILVMLAVLFVAVSVVAPDSTNLRVILAVVSGSSAATMMALRYYFK